MKALRILRDVFLVYFSPSFVNMSFHNYHVCVSTKRVAECMEVVGLAPMGSTRVYAGLGLAMCGKLWDLACAHP